MDDKEKEQFVKKLEFAVNDAKLQYLAVMESFKELKKIAESIGYEIDFEKTEVKKKTIVKLLK